jgi:outer membrane protein assembly factor BamB
LTKARSEAAHPINGHATPTPVTDGRNVYAFFPEIGLISFDANGKERWRAPMGPFHSVQGHATSPVYHDGMVFLVIDQVRDSYVAAFDAATGKQRWRAERASGNLGGYASPVIVQPARGPAHLVVAASLELTGYQAKTGERLWWAPGVTNSPASTPLAHDGIVYTMEPADEPVAFSNVASFDKDKNGRVELAEVADAGLRRLFEPVDEGGNRDGAVDKDEWDAAFASMTERGGLVATRLGASGQLPRSDIRWRIQKGQPYVTAPILYRGVLYVVKDGGILTARDPATGKVIKEGRLEGAIDKYYASPVAAGGKMYFASENGKIAVVEPGPDWRVLAVNDLDSPVYATPALASNRIFIRTRDMLYCFGGGEPAAAAIPRARN